MPSISSTGNDGKRWLNIFNSSYGVSGEASTIFAENYIEGMVKWKDIFYDYKPHVLLQALYEFGNGMIYIKHNYSELGIDEKTIKMLKDTLPEYNFMKEVLLVRSASNNVKMDKGM